MAAKGRWKEWLEEDKLLLLNGWKRNGLTDEQIAHNMNIAYSTLFEWKNKYPEISNALKIGRDEADIIVENAMFRAAQGYYVEEWEEKIDASGQVRKCHKKRYIAPSNTAQIFWLKNRASERWRDKPAEHVEQFEDDGLSTALEKSVDNQAQDDSFMIPEEENNND